ncbi:peroxisome biogenesis factor 2-like [Anneissia japonica]|uniref:peroxisome biogenesis factor 2-like n=1 Tax=Anneissia japonica TaxID=1529436 RepID=UPI0014259FF1|nr:peroxisome biogenesis factor 2-like [Anneissia japonica]
MDSNNDENRNGLLALRVNQLDSSELDNEILQIIKAQLSNVFKYFKPGYLSKIEPELNTVIRLLIWKYSVFTNDATLGQQMLNIKYRDAAKFGPLHTRQRWLLGVVLVGLKWIQERSMELSSLTRETTISWIIGFVNMAEKLLKVASLVNFLLFLRDGQYQFLFERIIGVRATFSKPQFVRQVSFEFMTRELMWHGFSEFLFFILPLINYRRIQNFFRRKLRSPSSPNQTRSSRPLKTYKECAICGEWPTMPREIGCLHVYCYYCIQSNMLADSSYSCPLCSYKPDGMKSIKEVSVEIS